MADNSLPLGSTLEELLLASETDFALLADLFELSQAGDERPLSRETCEALAAICLARFSRLQKARKQLPVAYLNRELR